MVRYVVHVSDVHIRTGDALKCRFDEYKQVIDKLGRYVATNLPQDQTVAVVTGDVFHNKGRVEAPGIKLFQELLTGLSDACSAVYIIRGNHDFKQESPAESDLVGTLLRNSGLGNVHYLDSTGHHLVDATVGFGLVAIHDSLLLNCATGVRDDLPPFPSATDMPCEHRLALFHGTVNRSKAGAAAGALTLSSGYPAEWFAGYDAVLLGDVHLQQVMGGESMGLQKPELVTQDVTVLQRHRMRPGMMAYAGSLVQQDFGETLLGHGFLLWDLEERVVACMHVNNDHGYITLNADDAVQVRFADTNAWLPLSLASSAPWFPRKVVVRGSAAEAAECACSACSLEVVGAPTMLFQRTQTQAAAAASCDGPLPPTMDGGGGGCGDDLVALCSTDSWIAYVKANVAPEKLTYEGWQDWLREPGTLKAEAPNKEREDRIAKKVDAYVDGCERHGHHSFKLMSMSWEWLLCFKDHNAFDFCGMDGQISVLNGRNGAGKTSFLECICVALFGEGFPSRHSKTYTASIINNQKPYHCTAFVQLVLDTPAGTFTIKRAFQQADDPHKVLTVAKETYVRGPNGNTVAAKGKTAVDKWVEQHVGTQDSFLMSCMLTQSSDRDFFGLPSAAQKQMLDQALNLDVHGRLMEALREARLAQVVAANSVADKLTVLTAHKAGNVRDRDTDSDIQELQSAVSALELQKTQHQASKPAFSSAGGAGRYRSIDAALAALQDLEDVSVSTEEQESLEEQLALNTLLVQQSAPFVSASVSVIDEMGPAPAKTFESAKDDLKVMQRWKAAAVAEVLDTGTGTGTLTEEQASAEWEATMQRKPPQPSKLLPMCGPDGERTLSDEEKARLKELQQRHPEVTAIDKVPQLNGVRLEALRAKWGDHCSTYEEQDSTALPARPDTMRLDWSRAKFTDMSAQLEYELGDEEQVRAYRDGLTKKIVRYEEAERELKEAQRLSERYVNHPFNPDCAACRRAPWKVHSEELSAKEAQMKARLTKLGGDKQALLDERAALEKNLALMAELRLMELALAYQDAIERQEYRQLCKAHEVRELLTLMNRARAEQHDVWVVEERQAKAAWDSARQCGERNMYQADLQRCGTIEENAATCAQWSAVYRRQAAELQAKKTKLVALAAVAHFQAADLDVKLLEAKLQLNLALKEQARVAESQSLQDGLLASKALLESKMATMEHIITCLGGYQAWIYRSTVLPTICRHVNAILDVMRLHPSLRLSCTLQDGGTDLSWFLGQPPLCRASGFQRFICGLGMRIALSRIGASEVRNRQLIIDEGFTACDTENLCKVPDFLRGLLQMYDSILMVTHLEELKESVDCVYDIADFKA